MTEAQKAALAGRPLFEYLALDVAPPPRRKPHVIIYDVDGSDPDKTTLRNIYTQNVKDLLSRTEFADEFKKMYEYRKHNPPDDICD